MATIISYRNFLFVFILLFLSCTNKDRTGKLPVDLMLSEKISKDALSKSWKLLKTGQQLANEGYSMNEIIKSLPDSTLVQTNASSILFFIEGSIPMMIEMPKDPSLNELTKGGGMLITAPKIHSTKLLANLVASPFEENDTVDIVANEKGDEEREKKRALILAPYIQEFGIFDDGLAARKYLSKNKNYEGWIDYISQGVLLDTYASFAEYDLVHLSTHGERFCSPIQIVDGGQIIDLEIAGENTMCKILIDSGVIASESPQEFLDFVSSPQYEAYKEHVIIKEGTFLLKSSFFTSFYGAGLENKIWIFSACELGRENDLVYSIENILENGHFFYWLNEVSAPDAFSAFEKFYELLVDEGLDATEAFKEIPSNLKENLPSQINDSVPIPAKTRLLHNQTGDPRHGIEIIEMQNLEEEDQRLQTGDFYPLVGDFGDGNDEALTLKVQLIGYTRQEFEEKQMHLGLKVDDEIVLWNKPFLPDEENDDIEVEDLEDKDYGIEVTIADIDIPDVGDKVQITLKAYLHFDNERYSIHKEEVIIKAEGIRATIKGEGKTTTLTYSEKTKAMRIETSGSSSPTYMDKEGGIYNFDDDSGWMRMNLGGLMGKSMGGIMQDNQNLGTLDKLFAGGQLESEDYFQATSTESFGDKFNMGSSNFFFPMVEWGIRFRASAFERNTNFKKQEVDCGEPTPCNKFVGLAGQEKGVQATFEPGGRLKKLLYGGMTIDYKYGDFQVELPEAKEFEFPF